MTSLEAPDLDDAVGRRLTASAPQTTKMTAGIEDELARMSVAARTETPPAKPVRRRTPRLAAFAVAGLLALGGAGAAAAATENGWTSFWASNPDNVYHYTLPSGAVCEARLGNISATTGPPEVATVLRDYLAQHSLTEVIDVNAEIARMRADRDIWWVGSGGRKEPDWYGTEHYPSPDQEYANAVAAAIDAKFESVLREHGFVHDERALVGRGC